MKISHDYSTFPRRPSPTETLPLATNFTFLVHVESQVTGRAWLDRPSYYRSLALPA